ncbi:MAG TPA: tRNA (adenosine(37)-N6)-threonylcarbamoyltransferase complex ATPase subunit type 1 TsaE [Gammaproteobacteria bacterium]|nr:tRNA (adenosine(37)-N6)-threonylcarbamoyltransferase complex ATPase subunit type 1 TsaE [Gammaproteobacteria bacterium]
MTTDSIALQVPDESSLLAFSAKLATLCGDTAVIFLSGPLGVGKTTFARGFLRGLNYKGHVKSPTYTLVEPYELSSGHVFHFDLYRLHDARELEEIGIRDYFVPHAICLIEWAEQGKGVLPLADLSCYIAFHPRGREVKLVAHSARGNTILQRLL